MTAVILPFPTLDKRCCKCVHWTPIDGLGPQGACGLLAADATIDDAKNCLTNQDWSCPLWRADRRPTTGDAA